MFGKKSSLRYGWLLACAWSVAGCYAEARTEPAYVEAEWVPARVDVYPSYYYDGRVVYLIDGRWYYRHPRGHWVYYRREPEPLYRQRLSIQQAPPAAAGRRRLPPDIRRDDRAAPPAYRRDDAPPVRRPPRRHDDDRHDRRDRRDHDDWDRRDRHRD